jgi:hypothetical protein
MERFMVAGPIARRLLPDHGRIAAARVVASGGRLAKLSPRR